MIKNVIQAIKQKVFSLPKLVWNFTVIRSFEFILMRTHFALAYSVGLADLADAIENLTQAYTNMAAHTTEMTLAINEVTLVQERMMNDCFDQLPELELDNSGVSGMKLPPINSKKKYIN